MGEKLTTEEVERLRIAVASWPIHSETVFVDRTTMMRLIATAAPTPAAGEAKEEGRL